MVVPLHSAPQQGQPRHRHVHSAAVSPTAEIPNGHCHWRVRAREARPQRGGVKCGASPSACGGGWARTNRSIIRQYFEYFELEN